MGPKSQSENLLVFDFVGSKQSIFASVEVVSVLRALAQPRSNRKRNGHKLERMSVSHSLQQLLVVCLELRAQLYYKQLIYSQSVRMTRAKISKLISRYKLRNKQFLRLR
jgi:hypothetical protein